MSSQRHMHLRVVTPTTVTYFNINLNKFRSFRVMSDWNVAIPNPNTLATDFTTACTTLKLHQQYMLTSNSFRLTVGTCMLCVDGQISSYFLPVKMSRPTRWTYIAKTSKRLHRNRWNCALFTWQRNFARLLNCCYCVDHTQNLIGPAPNNVLRALQVSFISFTFELQAMREHRQTVR